MIEQMLQAERALLHGMVDQAERIYRLVIEQDPRNSIAVVGLARVALERGDDRGALDLARQALQIDPENQAARRLAERMAEVLRFRGETIDVEIAATPPAPAQQQPVRGRALLDRFRRER